MSLNEIISMLSNVEFIHARWCVEKAGNRRLPERCSKNPFLLRGPMLNHYEMNAILKINNRAIENGCEHLSLQTGAVLIIQGTHQLPSQ